MKKSKKLLSLFAALAMVAQAGISAPLVMAEDEVETEAATKVGLILNIDGSKSDAWTLVKGDEATTVTAEEDEDGTTYVKLTPSGTYNATTNAPYIYATLPDGGIKFEDDKIIVIDTRVTGNDMDAGVGRLQIKWNIPETMNASVQLKYNGTRDLTGINGAITGDTTTGFQTKYAVGSNHLTLADFLANGIRLADGILSADKYSHQTKWSTSSLISTATSEYVEGTKGNLTDKWWRVVIYMKPGYEMVYKIYNANNELIDERTGTLGWIDQSDNLENIAIQSAISMLNYAKVDYLKVYNMPKDCVDNFENISGAYDEVEISDIMVDGIALEEVEEATKGTVTFSSTADVAVKEIYYKNRVGDKTPVAVTDYTFENNTIKFTNALANKAEYTVVLDLGNGFTKDITFNSGWKDQVGLIYTADGVAGDWTVPAGLDASVVPAVSYSEAGVEPNYASFTVSGAEGSNKDLTIPYILANLGDNKIKFEDDKTIVVETRLKLTDLATSGNRVKIGYNLPESDISSFKLYDKVNDNSSFDYRSNMGDSQLFEFLGADTSYVRWGAGIYWAGENGWAASESEPIDGQWFKVVIHVNPGFIFDYYLYDEDGNKLLEKTSQDMTYVTNSKYFENVAVIMSNGTYAATTDIDYVKVYNMPEECADNFENISGAYDEVEISDIMVDGIALEEVEEATEGTVTFTSTADVSVKEIYYKNRVGDKTPVAVTDYTFENNTIKFTNALANKAEYTVVLDLGNGFTKEFTFNSEWKDRIGLIYNQEAETNTDWAVNNSEYLSVSQDATSGFVKYVTGDYSWITPKKVGNVKIPLGDKKIKFKDDKVIVIESKVKVKRPDGEAGRFGMYYNIEHQITDEGVQKAWDVGVNHLFLAGLAYTAENAFYAIYPQGVPSNSIDQTSIKWPAAISGYDLDGTETYKMVVKLDKCSNSLEYEVYNAEDSQIAAYTSTDLGWITANDFLTSVAFGNMSYNVESFEVDYLKIYNMPKGAEDGYAAYTTSYDEVEISNIKVDGVDVDKADDVKVGTVTFDSNADVSVKEVYYTLVNGNGEKTAVTDYTFNNNTLTFTNGLVKSAEYTVVLDLGNLQEKVITFNSDYDNPIGLVLSYEGSTDDEWVAAKGTNAAVSAETDEEGTTYTRMTPSAANDYMYASLQDGGIKYKEGEVIVIDTRVRGGNITTDNDARLQVKWNMPQTDGEAFTLKYNGTEDMTGANGVSGDVENGFTTPYSNTANHLALAEIANSWSRFSNGNPAKGASDNRFQNHWKRYDMEANATNNKWYRIVIEMRYGFEMTYKFYDENDVLLYEETGKISWVEQSDFLKNIAIETFKNAMDSADVDYLRVYNIKEGTEYSLNVTTADDGENVSATCSVTYQGTLVDKGAVLYIAAYDANNKLVSVDSADVTTGETTVTVKKASTFKTFLWTDDMQPIEYEAAE